jgi:phage/plasmid-like protein (TIGR03299 family)
MSMETSPWLNTMVLVGMTDKRGDAWHKNLADQGSESNHYPLAIPVSDVRRRLFNWQPKEGQVSATVLSDDGVWTLNDDTRKAIIRPAGSLGEDDRGAILGIFKNGYRIHDYDQWLVRNVEALLDQDAEDGYEVTLRDDGLYIASAGLLKQGAVAWVQFETPKVYETAGVKFRPFISSATSLDGSLSSTYLSGVEVIVCDNTLSAALGSDTAKRIKVKHSRNSLGKINDVREALEIVAAVGDDFSEQVEEQTNTTVSDEEWAKFQDEIASLVDEKGNAKEGRSLTLAQSKRETLDRLWNHDNRVAPWKGTAFGVIQAVNTATHHEFTVRGAERAERNMLRTVTGEWDKLDRSTLDTLQKVLA